MSSTYNNLGFNELYIKGVLFDIASFRGEPGEDQTSTTKGPNGAAGGDGGFEFSTVNTTPSSTIVELTNPANASYDGIIVKCNGKLTSTTEMTGDLKSIKIVSHDGVILATLYNNDIAQTVRFTKVTLLNIEVDGVMRDTYSTWRI